MVDLISVIVPVYNVATYLPQCLESILTQDYPHLEVILINDGSTDSSGAICDDYAIQDSRIRVIHQKNSGAAAAKNAGLRVATGTYLSFVDSDDFLEPNAYSHMIDLMKQYNADVVQCSMRNIYKNGHYTEVANHKECRYTQTEYLHLYTQDWTCALMTDKLYRRSLFDKIFFEEGHKIDDEYFTYQGIMNARVVAVDNFCVYNYRRRRSSVMLSPQSRKQIVLDRIDFTSKRKTTVIKRYPELRKAFDRHFLEMMVILSRDPAGTEQSLQIIRQKLSEYFHEKGHTTPDFRLLPALWKIQFGKVTPPYETPNKDTDDDVYFD